MAIHQVTIPWAPGFDVGVGADLASGSPMNSPVTPEATPVEGAAGSTIDIQIQRINSTEDLERALGVDVEANYGCGSFGPSMSARFSFAQKSKVQASSLFMTVTVRVQLEFLSIDTPRLTDKAAAVVSDPEAFEARYGNMFVRGIGRGGLFVGVLRIDTGSSEKSTEISAQLEGSYGLFSAEASAKFSEIQKTYKSEVFVRQYQEGGPKNLTIDDPADPLRLLQNANKFLEAFNVDEAAVAKVAVPFQVTLAPTTIVEGPMPPNPAEVQQAQDVLLYCARKRSAFLDHLNLLEYVIENKAQYAFTDDAQLAEISAATSKYQDDLELIAACASAAIKNRAAAVYPENFAEAQGKVFPGASMPAIPAPAAGVQLVAAPDFSGCTTQEACKELATQHQLGVTFVTAAQAAAPFAVLAQVPATGTEVPLGTVVQIIYPPTPVDPGLPPGDKPLIGIQIPIKDLLADIKPLQGG